MQAEPCYECMQPVLTDGVLFRCDACDREGYYVRALCGTRIVRVRMITRWRDQHGRVRRG